MKDIFSNQMSKNKMNFNNATTVINKVIIGEIFSTKKKKGNYSFYTNFTTRYLQKYLSTFNKIGLISRLSKLFCILFSSQLIYV